MKVKVTELSGEESHLHWEIGASWLAKALEDDSEHDGLEASLFAPSGPLRYEAWVYRSEGEVYFRADVTGEMRATCVRCLEENALPLHLEFSGIFLPYDPALGDEVDDPAHFFYSQDEVDFGVAFREHLFLHLPLNPNCGEVGCKGEVQAPAVTQENDEEEEEAVDPRWAALREISKKVRSNKS